MGGSAVMTCLSMVPYRQASIHVYQPLPTHTVNNVGKQFGLRGKLDLGRLHMSFGETKSNTPRRSLSASADSSFSLSEEAALRESRDGAVVPGSVDEATEFAAQVAATVKSNEMSEARRRRWEKAQQRQSERLVYMVAAIASTLGITAGAGAAVWYRFAFQMQSGTEIPYVEMVGTFALTVGAAVGMEFWARWAHRALWHDSLWSMHESHHRPREGPFELNDIFAIINAVPAIALIAYGFFNKGIFPGACFGAGLGITLFGMAYMFVHDGLVHKRFAVGPVADVPYLQRVAAAHQLHHADKFNGVPFGLFLGPGELEKVGGTPDLDALLESRKKGKN